MLKTPYLTWDLVGNTMKLLTLNNKYLTLGLDPCGAQICFFATKDGFDILQRRPHLGEANDESALFPLLPIANRVSHDSYHINGEHINLPLNLKAGQYLHGDGWVNTWQVKEKSESSATLTLNINHDNGYVYTACFALKLQALSLKLTLTVCHQGSKPRLYGLGLHPYFALDDSATLHFASDGYFPEGAGHMSLPFTTSIPTSEDFNRPRAIPPYFVNQLYHSSSPLYYTRQGRRMCLSSNCPYLMLYHLPQGSFVALEPLMHEIDAVNKPQHPGMVLLQKGQTTSLHVSIELLAS